MLSIHRSMNRRGEIPYDIRSLLSAGRGLSPIKSSAEFINLVSKQPEGLI